MTTDIKVYRDDENQLWRIFESVEEGYFILAECDENGIIPTNPTGNLIAWHELENLTLITK